MGLSLGRALMVAVVYMSGGNATDASIDAVTLATRSSSSRTSSRDHQLRSGQQDRHLLLNNTSSILLPQRSGTRWPRYAIQRSHDNKHEVLGASSKRTNFVYRVAISGANFREIAKSEVQLPSIPLPRTRVNKVKKKGQGTVGPRPSGN